MGDNSPPDAGEQQTRVGVDADKSVDIELESWGLLCLQGWKEATALKYSKLGII